MMSRLHLDVGSRSLFEESHGKATFFPALKLPVAQVASIDEVLGG